MSVTAELLTNDVMRLKCLFNDWAHSPLEFLKNKGTYNLPGYYLDDVQATSKDDDTHVILAEEKGEILGCAVLGPLPWETGYFKKRMGVIKYLVIKNNALNAKDIAGKLLDKCLQISINRDLEFLLCKCGTNDVTVIHALEDKGFLVMDTMLNFVYDYNSPQFDTIVMPDRKTGFSVRQANEADCGKLMELSRVSFSKHFGRFHADERIPTEQATGIYEQWLKSSCAGWADWIVIAEYQGEIAGYSVWKKPSGKEAKYSIDLGHYSIGAIGPAYQQKGLFALLTYEGMKLLKDCGRYIEGPTHVNNYGVQRGYAKLGWKICDARHSFHKWL